MHASTTRRDEVNPWAHTVPARPAELRKQIEAVFKRIDARPPRPRLEPEMYWEEPGLHGPNGRARLRPRVVVGEAVRAHHAETGKLRLPPPPSRGSDTQLLVVGGVALVGALALYLWTKRAKKPEVAALDGLPAWAMT